MSSVNSGSKAQQVHNMCTEVRKVFSLDWDNFVAYSNDTNSMIALQIL